MSDIDTMEITALATGEAVRARGLPFNIEFRSPISLDGCIKFGVLGAAVIVLAPVLLIVGAFAMLVPHSLGVPLHGPTSPVVKSVPRPTSR